MGWNSVDRAHVGWVGQILPDGEDIDTWSRETNERVIGWRARCECGWTGKQSFARTEDREEADDISRFYSEDAFAPESVDEDLYQEWLAHVRPHELVAPVRVAAKLLADASQALDEAVRSAHEVGVPWPKIGTAAGTTAEAAEERWGAP